MKLTILISTILTNAFSQVKKSDYPVKMGSEAWRQTSYAEKFPSLPDCLAQTFNNYLLNI
ncbi:MAG: hypothetical protein Q8R96_19015 [Bacteroidota bacterium]|nr:hypothetical protein [Bacteroidota bacterium]